MNFMKMFIFLVVLLLSFEVKAGCYNVFYAGAGGNVRINEYKLRLSKPEIITPKPGDYHIAVRDDSAKVAEKLASVEGFTSNASSLEALASTYRDFYNSLFLEWGKIFREKISDGGRVHVDIFSLDNLSRLAKRKAGGDALFVSLDSLQDRADLKLEQSMRWILEGNEMYRSSEISGQVARPGSKPLQEQIGAIQSAAATGKKVILHDDVVFSGDTLVSTISDLRARGIVVDSVVTDIKMGEANFIGEKKTPITGLVTYRVSEDQNIFDRANMYGQSDFLMGIGGLVVQLPSGKLGRAPYIWPFIDVSYQAGAQGIYAEYFSRHILKHSLSFYKKLANIYGRPVLLKDTDVYFQNYMVEVFGFSKEDSMESAIAWLDKNINSAWNKVEQLSQEQRKLLGLKLNSAVDIKNMVAMRDRIIQRNITDYKGKNGLKVYSARYYQNDQNAAYNETKIFLTEKEFEQLNWRLD